MNQRFIYALIDPRDGAIRYVGKSACGMKRPEQHRTDKTQSHRGHWIRKLCSLGLTFGVTILESEPDDLDEAERFWIAAYRVSGRLTNMTAGGDGGLMSDEVKSKIRHKLLGRQLSIETRTKMSAAQQGKRHTIESRLKIAKAAKGNTAFSRIKANESWRGRKHSEESKAKMRMAWSNRS